MSDVNYMSPYQARAAEPELDTRDASASWRWTAFLLSPIIWFLPAAVLSIIVGILTGLIWVPLGMTMSPFATLVLLYMVARARDKARARNGRTILSYLDVAVRMNLPLPPFLGAAESSERGATRWQLRKLRERLEMGYPVSAALGVVRDVPEETVTLLAAHESLGQLQPALARLQDQQKQKEEQERDRPEESAYTLYPLVLLLVIISITAGLFILVVPKFIEIFKDFKVPMPPSMERLAKVSYFLVDSPLIGIPILFAIVFVAATVLGSLMQRVFVPNLPQPKFAEYAAWLRWRLPFFHGLERDSGMAASCDLLSESLAAGVTFPAAAGGAAKLPVNPGLRKKLNDFHARLLNGQPAAAAATGAQLPPLVVGVLAPVSAAGVNASASAMFAFLARYYRQKFSRAVIFLQAAAAPLAVLLMGSLVLCILYAVFTAMTAILQSSMPGNLL